MVLRAGGMEWAVCGRGSLADFQAVFAQQRSSSGHFIQTHRKLSFHMLRTRSDFSVAYRHLSSLRLIASHSWPLGRPRLATALATFVIVVNRGPSVSTVVGRYLNVPELARNPLLLTTRRLGLCRSGVSSGDTADRLCTGARCKKQWLSAGAAASYLGRYCRNQ